jgi:hypothetical protein
MPATKNNSASANETFSPHLTFTIANCNAIPVEVKVEVETSRNML